MIEHLCPHYIGIRFLLAQAVSVLLGLAGGITYFVLAQRRHEPNQRELAVLFSLILFVLGGWFGLIPGLSAVPTIGEVHR